MTVESTFKGKRSQEKNQKSKRRGETRKEANIARHAEYQKANAKLTPAERIAKLDKAFGKGKGAKRERARFAVKS